MFVGVNGLGFMYRTASRTLESSATIVAPIAHPMVDNLASPGAAVQPVSRR
jgi:hypothetical protein